MTEPDRGDFVAELCLRRAAEGNVFRVTEDELAVFDSDVARRINAANYADLLIGDSFLDTLRGRESCPVSWASLRRRWLARLRELSTSDMHATLRMRMAAVVDARLGERMNLSWLAQEIITRPLVPVIIDGLSPGAARAVHADLIWKITHLMRTVEPVRRRQLLWFLNGMFIGQPRAGLAVRAELRGRARGTRPPRADLAQPLVEDLGQLGLDRAVDSLTTVLTAIGGPPGAAGASLMYELVNQPEWARRLTAELSEVDLAEFLAAPIGTAPLTARFLREVLRMWSPPLLLSRVVRTPLEVPDGTLTPGQQYLLSPFMVHHDPRNWPDPDTFDPDRWLPDATDGRPANAHYVPFGWAPTSCLGAGVGLTQLMLLCHLLCTRYRVEADPGFRMMLAAVPIPHPFTGTLTRR